MDEFSGAILNLLGLSFLNLVGVAFLLALFVAGVAVYVGLGSHVLLRGNGKVAMAELGAPDLGLATFLIVGFLIFSVLGYASGSVTISGDAIKTSAGLYLFLVMLILSFLYFRRIDLEGIFGFDSIKLSAAVGSGLCLLAAAYPLIIAIGQVSESMLGDDLEQQEVVEFFLNTTDGSSRVLVIVLAIVVAPVAEELIFRGYLHGVLKRFFGTGWAIFVTAALFAFVHGEPSLLAIFFVLAVCLSLSYEATGSILVPMTMHVAFNAISILFLLSRISE